MDQLLKNIYLITIREEKKKKMLEQLGPMLSSLVTIVHGVNGRDLDRQRLIDAGVYRSWFPMTRGEIGCFLSHRHVWLDILDKKIPYALILEDDTSLDSKSVPVIQRQIEELTALDPSWNLLFLGRNEDLAQNLYRVSENLVVPGRSWGLFAYVVSAKAARILANKSRTITVAADIFVSSISLPGKYACAPSLCSVNKEISDTFGIK